MCRLGLLTPAFWMEQAVHAPLSAEPSSRPLKRRCRLARRPTELREADRLTAGAERLLQSASVCQIKAGKH
jgi:hypothetical protein